MIRRPRRSTLFPTRRSSDLSNSPGPAIPAPAGGHRVNQASRGPGAGRGLGGFVWRSDDRGKKDRKSTRLNSSHLGISYAVFCLKKKNYNKTLLATDTHTPTS